MQYKNTNPLNIPTQIDINTLKQDLLGVFKNPNPLSIYMKSKELNDTLSDFLTQLSQKISDGFIISENEKTFLSFLYKNTSYHKIWLQIGEGYLRESKNFDILSYFYFVKTLNTDKKFLGLGLYYIYIGYSSEQINTIFANNNIGLSYENLKKIYDTYKIGDMHFSIQFKEEFIENFLEKIYIKLPNYQKNQFLDCFVLRLDKNNIDYESMSLVLMKIVRGYIHESKFESISRTVYADKFHDTKVSIDNLLENYSTSKPFFYTSVCDILREVYGVDRVMFWQYIRTYIINNYYSEIEFLFYGNSSKQFLDKDTYTKLKGNLNILPSHSPESEYLYNEIYEIMDLKQIILELSDNLFSFFLLPIIYHNISEKLSIKKGDLQKMKYLLMFIFTENYSEYKKIYMFFNQLEVFLNYDKKPQVWEKIQVCFSIIILVVLSLVFAYHYLPIGVFIGIFVLSLIKYTEVIYPNFYFKLKFNSGLKFFATVFLCLSTYFWILNFDKVKEDTHNFSAKIENLGKLSSKDAIQQSGEYLKASIFDIK